MFLPLSSAIYLPKKRQNFMYTLAFSEFMGIVEWLLGSEEAVAKEIEQTSESVAKHWKNYLETVNKKKEIVERLTHFNYQQEAAILRDILKVEISDIAAEEKDENVIISDLNAVEHSKKIKRVHKIEQCLCYIDRKYAYAYTLIEHIHSVLNSQMQIVTLLIKGTKKADVLIIHLKSQSEIESELIQKINESEKTVGQFHDLLVALVKGEHIIKRLDSREKRLLKKLHKGALKVFAEEKSDGIFYEWAMEVLNGIEDQIHEAVVKQILPGHNKDIDFEYVNRPEFVDYSREVLQRLSKRKVPEERVNVLVHLFREWFCYDKEWNK
jgi:hypothetical protein